MKKILFTSLVLILALSSEISAQCNQFYNFKDGGLWEITNFSANDKKESRQLNTIKSLTTTDTGWEAMVNMQSFDKKDKLAFEKDVDMGCADGVISLNMERFFPEETMKAFKDMNMSIETENLEIPSSLSVGDELKDASLKLSGDIPFTMEVRVTNRKVVGKETITTSAGTFECFKITYTVVSKSIMNMETSGADWIAENVGMVRSENYAKNGKLSSYSLLTKFE